MRIKRLCITGVIAAAAPLLMAPPNEGCGNVCGIRLSATTKFTRSLASESAWQEFEVTKEGRHYVEVSLGKGRAEVELIALSSDERVRDVRCDGDALLTFCEFDAQPGSRVGVSIIPVTPSADVTILAGLVAAED